VATAAGQASSSQYTPETVAPGCHWAVNTFGHAIAHDLRRTAVRNLERAGVSRSVAMSLTGHKTEAVYRRYAIVDSAARREAVTKLAHAQSGDKTGTIDDGVRA